MEIKITKINKSNINNIDIEKLGATDFGKYHTDHMFSADYENGKWGNFQIQPFGPITFSPFLSALHYGQSIFEGLKAYKLENNQLVVFRMKDHSKRLNISATRMAMQNVPEEVFCEGLTQLLKIDKEWAYKKEGWSIYIRPFLFSTEETLGVKISKQYKFMIVLSPVSAYFSKILKIKVETEYSRASMGGTGFTKCAGNYGGALLPTAEANEQGFDQILWTDAKEHKYVEELGVTNVMFYANDTFYTPSLDDKTSLDGITRRSIIEYLKHLNYKVVEKKIHIDEILEWQKQGILKEAFGMGTAATLTIIGSINYKSIEIKPTDTNFTMNKKIIEGINAIRYGKAKDEFGWLTFID